MRAADVADAVSHSDDGEAEGNGHTEETNVSEQCGTATAEHQDECTQTFGKHFVTKFHKRIF